jgi:hypothetical protein
MSAATIAGLFWAVVARQNFIRDEKRRDSR